MDQMNITKAHNVPSWIRFIPMPRVVKHSRCSNRITSHHKKYKGGGQLRDFIWVRDCVDVMLWMLDHPKVNGVFNLGTGKARSFADLASAVYKAAGKKPMIKYRPMPAELQ